MATPTFGQKNLPNSQVRFVKPDGTLDKYGLDYLNSLFKQVNVPVASVATGLTATGTTQGTAFVITTQWSDFSTVGANSGCLLQGYKQGQQQEVYNGGGNALKVYPPVGCQIDALGNNNPYSLNTGKRQVFKFSTATQIRSTQLG